MHIWLVKRAGIAGQRGGVYRVESGGFTEVAKMKIQFTTTELPRVAEPGSGSLKRQPAENRERLEEYRGLCVFLDREFPALAAKWEREGKKAKP